MTEQCPHLGRFLRLTQPESEQIGWQPRPHKEAVVASQNRGVDRRVLALWHAKIFVGKKVLACEMVVGCGLLVCHDVDVVWEKLAQTVLRLHHHGPAVDVCVVVV